jgi:hypothetical protein
MQISSTRRECSRSEEILFTTCRKYTGLVNPGEIYITKIWPESRICQWKLRILKMSSELIIIRNSKDHNEEGRENGEQQLLGLVEFQSG